MTFLSQTAHLLTHPATAVRSSSLIRRYSRGDDDIILSILYSCCHHLVRQARSSTWRLLNSHLSLSTVVWNSMRSAKKRGMRYLLNDFRIFPYVAFYTKLPYIWRCSLCSVHWCHCTHEDVYDNATVNNKNNNNNNYHSDNRYNYVKLCINAFQAEKNTVTL